MSLRLLLTLDPVWITTSERGWSCRVARVRGSTRSARSFSERLEKGRTERQDPQRGRTDEAPWRKLALQGHDDVDVIIGCWVTDNNRLQLAIEAEVYFITAQHM